MVSPVFYVLLHAWHSIQNSVTKNGIFEAIVKTGNKIFRPSWEEETVFLVLENQKVKFR